MPKTTEQKLEDAIKGWVVVGVEQSTSEEGLFTLIVQKQNDTTQKRVEICGTELGWWIGV